MPPTPRFAVALVNYKTENLTSACLERLKSALTEFESEVWVVDNDSDDGSTDYLRSLDWIHLIERKPEPDEAGFLAHGRALNMIMACTPCDYVFLMHTDTFIHNAEIFRIMLNESLADHEVFVVGCLEQIHRGTLRSAWRLTTRVLSHYSRKLRQTLDIPGKPPRPFRETHVKSFFALWKRSILHTNKLSLLMSERIPGYEAQDVLLKAGYQRRLMSPRHVFRHIEHAEAGTVSATGGYTPGHRRLRKYNRLIARYALG